MIIRIDSFCFLLLFVVGCQPESVDHPARETHAEGAWFQDVTDEAGLRFTHDAGAEGEYFMPEHIGSGAALFDFNRDGLLDIYLIQNAGPDSGVANVLYRQESDGRFTDVSEGSGLNVSGYGMGAAAGDVNNDGWPDLVVTEYTGVRLFVNRGDGSFTEQTRTSGLDNPHWATSASFIDYDRDGWLDLAVANYVEYPPTQKCYDANGQLEYCAPSSLPPSVSKLFRNKGGDGDGAKVRFQDVTVSSGLAQINGPSLGVLCADFNRDRWPDIFFADDGEANRLWINQKDGTFTEEATLRGLAYNLMGQAQADMGLALGDVDGNGLFDVFSTHLFGEYHALWKQNSSGLFMDQTAASQLMQSHWRGTGFGTVMADFDLNTTLDIALVNGRIKRGQEIESTFTAGLDPFWHPYAERHQLFSNQGQGKFTDISNANPALSERASVGRGLAVGDIDNDGRLDLLITSIGGHVQLLKNTSRHPGHWIQIRAVDPALGGREDYGAEITVSSGGRNYWRLVQPAYSFLCSNDSRVHFGLGESGSVDSIQVLWSDGVLEQFEGTTADQIITLKKGSGTESK